MIDYNGMLIRLGLFYARRLKNYVHIYIFCSVVYKEAFIFTQSNRIRIIFKLINLINW